MKQLNILEFNQALILIYYQHQLFLRGKNLFFRLLKLRLKQSMEKK